MTTNDISAVKRVLVVGANSYIGDSFARYARKRLCVDIVDSYEGWKTAQYNEYDSVLMVAGLAHQKWTRKQQEANKDMYNAINSDLAIAVAKKAKAGGVGQFIYLSSMAVYGRAVGAITTNTKVMPKDTDYYGLSKYRAETALASLSQVGTSLCIVRPPMVYGPGCPGKFASLVKVAKVLPFIPFVDNKRSMIFIDNLCEFLCLAIERHISGVFHPHNNEYMNTTLLIKAIAKAMGKRRYVMPGLGLLVRCMMPFSSTAKTAFGSLYYDGNVAAMPFKDDYQVVSIAESVVRSLCNTGYLTSPETPNERP
ncbi:MAG: NAD-dependent epimerase/dehydratase family protein [Defluviitaleaceae bacterium]|nr:NAD-dependent epimerase/dehydratase family protein [Defluviitaleaceae bacterium]